MGVILSRILGSQIKYESDSITGLSAEEKTLLADTFAVLKQDLPKTGERLFILYFTDFPENKRYFRDFMNKTVDEIKGTPLLIAHATNVMSSIAGMMSLLNEPENLVVIIKKVGYGHGKRNINDQAFLDLKQSFLKLLQEKLSNKHTPKVEEVWSKTLDTIVSVFKQGMEEYHENKKSNQL